MIRRRRHEDEIAEYVDSPLMTRRLKLGDQLTSRVQGRHGVYHARATLNGAGEEGCTCPSPYWPCKHVKALKKTWQVAPASFTDLEEVLRKAQRMTKKELLETLRKAVRLHPDVLTCLGVQGFEPEVSGPHDIDLQEEDWDD